MLAKSLRAEIFLLEYSQRSVWRRALCHGEEIAAEKAAAAKRPDADSARRQTFAEAARSAPVGAGRGAAAAAPRASYEEVNPEFSGDNSARQSDKSRLVLPVLQAQEKGLPTCAVACA
ncbi:unnamed protein product [Effrenium voratum]|uniref:Uncharacterized protein n=1 Tax=Effrenium voratum TaxID=2562239 RepID=A0AA36I196_9DINO|nr:unnamed protein product [Effrenium voratum]CAJ1444154.1 unnamed protein product [Effrenium voratum]